MNEIMNYIFGSLRDSEKALVAIQRQLKSQARVNKSIEFFAIVMLLNIVVNTKVEKEQTKRIRKLEETIEELKCNNGKAKESKR